MNNVFESGDKSHVLITWVTLIRKEAWPFSRTSSGVRLRWELEEPQGPHGPTHSLSDFTPMVREGKLAMNNVFDSIPDIPDPAAACAHHLSDFTQGGSC